LVFNTVFAQQEVFPIGTGWIKNSDGSEREDMYRQAAECGININVGNVRSGERQAVLDSADKYNMKIVADWVAYNIDKYRYCSHRTYESTGYYSVSGNPRLQQIEAPICYYFDHEVGTEVSEGDEEEDYNNVKNSRKVIAPGTPGYLVWNISGNTWLTEGKGYYAKFRIKIDGDISADDLVAKLIIYDRSSSSTLAERIIYSSDFADVGNLIYKEIERYFYIPSTKHQTEEIDTLYLRLPADVESATSYGDMDFRVYWYGDVTMWLDNIKVMDPKGKTLLSHSKDSNIIAEMQSLHNYDSNHNTLIGVYQDEPFAYHIEPLHYLSDLLYEGAPSDNKNVVMQPALNKNYTLHQYVNMGSPETYQARYLLRDYYPIGADVSQPGEPGYNSEIQNIWDTRLIPELDNMRYISMLNNVPLWYYVQAHKWRNDEGVLAHRDPHPKEIRTMVGLGLAYGAKGIWYFLYASIDDIDTCSANNPDCIGLVSESFIPNDKWDEVQAINNDLQSMTPDILHLNWESAFTSGDQVPQGSYVSGVIGANYIEIANFQHETTGEKYFMLVNRQPENSQTMTVTMEYSDQTRLVEDVIASQKPWDGDQNRVAYRVLNSGENTFTIALEPGEGRLFRITSGLGGAIARDSYWSGDILIADNITVNDNISLTIYPSTTIKFDSGKKLTINGTLGAQGTADNHIEFTSSSTTPSRGDWYGIRFEDSSIDANCIVKYCEIEYVTYGIYCNRANPTIENNSISDCNYGIYLYHSSPANIETNSVTNNYTGIYGISSSPNITDNLFRDNSSNGVSFSGGAPIFYDNTFDDNCCGAYFVSGSSPKFGPTEGSDKGNNVITKNSYGIYAQYYSELFMGSHGYYPGARIGGYNSICDNSVRDATAYFYTDIEAEYNWWETSPVRLASYGSSINYSFALGSDPGGGSSLGKSVVIAEDNSENNDKWAGFDPNNPDINNLSDLWLWGHYLFINDKLEDAIEVYKILVNKFSGDNYANRSLVKIYHLYHETGKDGLAYYLNGLLNNSKINKNVHQIIYPLLMNAYLDDKDINSALNISETIMKKYPDSITEKTAIYNMVLAMLNDLKDIEKASKYTKVLKQKYPDDELTYMAREAMGEEVSWSLDKPVIEPETADVSLPVRYALHNNYPNPFNPITTLKYALKKEITVSIKIYDLLGKEVLTLVNENQSAGYKSVIWNGKDHSGNPVPSGIYICRMVSGDFTQSRKMLLMK
jgi:parallel beta-helix repeat protein